MTASSVYLPEDLHRFIQTAGENDFVEAKGPMFWDGKRASAELTKDIIAFANSREGGTIVIGKAEKGRQNGLSEEQAATFDTTRVAKWVNNHCSPKVRLTCHPIMYEGLRYIVIKIAEFDDIPVLCIKNWEDSNKLVLKQGTLFVRNTNAESTPIQNVDELRVLIGLATVKRKDEFASILQVLTSGHSIISRPSDDEQFKEEWASMYPDLEADFGAQSQLGAWQMSFHPVNYEPERYDELAVLKKLIEKHTVRYQDEFPSIHYSSHVREWGISSHSHRDAFGASRTGLFLFLRQFREDQSDYKSPWEPISGDADHFRNRSWPKGEWMEYKWNMFLVMEFFLFMSRFVHELEPADEVKYELVAQPLSGRHLVSLDPYVDILASDSCRANVFRYTRTIPAASLIASWEAECAKTLSRFFEFFGKEFSPEGILKWIERFKNRSFF